MASTLIASHSLTHMYQNGFYVIIPQIFQQLGLTYTQVGFMDTLRWLSSGMSTLVGGFFVDMFQHRRGMLVGLTMMLIGIGYLLVSLAPTYLLILTALVFTSIGGALWHPIALGLLSQRFPKQRGLMLSLHRASGSVGDTISPPFVGFLLGTSALAVSIFGLSLFKITGLGLDWRQVLRLGMPFAFVLSLILWGFLWNAGGKQQNSKNLVKNLKDQTTTLSKAIRNGGLITLLLVSALRGMGDRALLLFLGLYLSQELKMGPGMQGLYYGLLTLPAIATGPIMGAMSDKIGRKPLIIFILLASSVFPSLIVLTGNNNVYLAVAIGLFGLFLYAVNSLVQAAAMDVAEGLHLEGTLIGLLWGGNALFGSFSPFLVGWLADMYGVRIGFYYASAIFLLAGLMSLRLPSVLSKRR